MALRDEIQQSCNELALSEGLVNAKKARGALSPVKVNSPNSFYINE